MIKLLNGSLWQMKVDQIQPEAHYCDRWKYCCSAILPVIDLHHALSCNAAPKAISRFSRLVFVDRRSAVNAQACLQHAKSARVILIRNGNVDSYWSSQF